MYRFLEHDQADRISSACDIYDNAISLFGMSKSFSLAGLRIGWLTTQNTDVLKQFQIYKDYTTICNNAPGEILSLMALRTKAGILKRNLDIIGKNLKLLDHFFIEYAELFEWYKPKTGPIGFPELKVDKNSADFCTDLIEKKGVMLLPANQYDYAGNHFRISFARRNMPESLEKLREYIAEKYEC